MSLELRPILPRLGALASLCVVALAAIPPAWADNPVEIQGVDEEWADAVAAILPDRAPPESLFDAERLADEAAERARAFLRAEGFYAATISPGADDRPAAWILIAPGERFRLAETEILYEGQAPSEAARAALTTALLPLSEGAPARAAEILAAEAAGQRALRGAGYPDAEIGERRVVVDHATQLVTPTFKYAAGPSALLGRVRLSPEGIIRPSLAARMAPWEPGETYAPEKLSRLRRNAAATGAFTTVTATLAPEADELGRRDVILALEPRNRRTIELGGGYSTIEGAGVDVEWSRRNFLRRAETLTLAATLSEQRQRAGARLALPHASALGRTTHYALEAVSEDAGPYDRQALSVSWSVDAEPRQAFGLSYGLSASAELYDATAGVENATILTSFGDVRRDTTDSPLDARDGHILQLRAEPSVAFGDATIPFLRTLADARYYTTPDIAGGDTTFAARARAGWIAPLSGDDVNLPLDRLFYAGGGGSVRGYEFNSIFPGDPLQRTVPVGGRGLFEVSAEARFRFGGPWGAAAFLDGGSAFNDADEIEMQWGAGFGVRYDLGFAPLRIDVAVPLNGREMDDDYAIYLSIGQSF